MEQTEKTLQFKKTDIGIIPLDWDIAELHKLTMLITDGKHGDCQNRLSSGYYFLSAKDVSDGRLNYSDAREITQEDFADTHKRTCLEPGDVLLSNSGTIGRLAIAEETEKTKRTTFQKSVAIIKPNKRLLDSYFLYYYFLANNKRVKEAAGGTTQQNLLLKDLRAFKIASPSLCVQQKQVSPLRLIDNKISLNQKMNITIQEVGHALFNRWFVDFEFPNDEGKPYKSSGGELCDSDISYVPKYWRTGKLHQIAELMMGISPQGSSYNDNGEGMPLLNGAADFQEQVILPRKWTNNPIRVCMKGSLIFCIRATIGNAVFADNEYCLGRGVAALNPKNSVFTEFIYYILKGSFDELISKASGSVIIGLSKSDIEELPIIIPNNQTIERFHEICSVLFSRIVNQSQNNFTLATIRDYLLPKLMSGKIRVPVDNEKENQ